MLFRATPSRRLLRRGPHRGPRRSPRSSPRPAPAAWTPPRARLLRFLGGLAICVLGVFLSLRAGLGLSPWDVLHAGLSDQAGLSYGTVVIAVGLLVLLASWALGVRPGLGTLVNVLAVGWGLDALLATSWLEGLDGAPVAVRVLAVVAAVVALGFGAALYIGAGYGAGPRDSLMVACHQHGLPIGASRCVIEVSVLLGGWLLGGPVGVGTVLLALGIGPVVQVSFRVLRQQPPTSRPVARTEPARRWRLRPALSGAPDAGQQAA